MLWNATRGVVCGLTLLAACGFQSGCTSLEEAGLVRNEVAELHAQLDQRASELATAASAMEPHDPDRPAAEAIAAVSKARAQAVQVGLDHIQAVLYEAEHPSDTLTRTAESIGPWLPEPLRAPALLAAAAGALAWRSARLKQGLRSVALSIEAAKLADEEFDRCFDRHAETFRAAQTPLAQRVVRQVKLSPRVA
jgi:hypothetical protein